MRKACRIITCTACWIAGLVIVTLVAALLSAQTSLPLMGQTANQCAEAPVATLSADPLEAQVASDIAETRRELLKTRRLIVTHSETPHKGR